jgi:SAM-dependent methyltransferase
MILKKAIREEYADIGVDIFYQTFGQIYKNPHFPYIQTLLTQNKHRIDYSRVLDLSSGGGEVALVLRELGFDNTIGCDPYTKNLFEKNTGLKCFDFSFEDIINGKWLSQLRGYFNEEDFNLNEKYFSSIICSFAMHLCPEKQLYPLVQQLFLTTENIVIITPHKRPELEKLSNTTLLFSDFTLTDKGKKVFLKSYILRDIPI